MLFCIIAESHILVATNHLGGCEHVYLALSFTGNPVRELCEHTGGAETISVLREYEYDSNGNMTVDLNRGIKEIEYDLNNRPVSVTFSTRPAEQRTKYLRDASGRKLRTTYQTSRYASLGPDDLVHVDTLELNPGIYDHIETGVLRPLSSPGIGGTVERWDDGKVQPAENMLWNTNFIRDYCGDIIYKDGEVERILTDNGYAVPDSAGGYDYYYYVKDWQGNVRAVIDEANRRMELNSYYPYGMPMSSTASVQPYKYGGKELDRTNGLDMSCRYAYLLRRMRKFVSALDLYYLYHTVNQNRG